LDLNESYDKAMPSQSSDSSTRKYNKRQAFVTEKSTQIQRLGEGMTKVAGGSERAVESYRLAGRNYRDEWCLWQ